MVPKRNKFLFCQIQNARPIEEFNGAVLIKGSRAYKMERLLPLWAVEDCEPVKIAC